MTAAGQTTYYDNVPGTNDVDGKGIMKTGGISHDMAKQ